MAFFTQYSPQHFPIEWHLHQRGRHGVKKLRFGNIVTDIIYDGGKEVTIDCNAPFTLVINNQTFNMDAGAGTITINADALDARSSHQ